MAYKPMKTYLLLVHGMGILVYHSISLPIKKPTASSFHRTHGNGMDDCTTEKLLIEHTPKKTLTTWSHLNYIHGTTVQHTKKTKCGIQKSSSE